VLKISVFLVLLAILIVPALCQGRLGVVIVVNASREVPAAPYIAVTLELRESGLFGRYPGLEQDITVLDFGRSEHAPLLSQWGLEGKDAPFVAIGKLNARGNVTGIAWSRQVADPAEARAALSEELTGRQLPDRSREGIPAGWDRDGYYVNEKDGSVLVTVPAGEFFYGAAPNDAQSDDDKNPGQRLQLPAFQISKYEVTNAQYGRFVAATSHRSADNDRWTTFSSKWGARAPVVKVDWNDAQAYCQWAGLRLPSEQEWERAARGTDGSIYPWGNSWDASRAVFRKDKPSPVGSLLSGLSPAGCFDMAGNVWEWTSGNYIDTWSQSCQVLRGGSWETKNPAFLRVSYRGYYSPDISDIAIGFRCARTP